MLRLSDLIQPGTVASVLLALLVWDGILFLSLGTSPVLGNLRNDFEQDPTA